MNRVAVGCAAAISVVLLSGCAVTGTVAISPDDVVTINGTVSESLPAGSIPSTCERIRSSGLGLLVTTLPPSGATPSPGGQTPSAGDSDRTLSCQVTGTVGIQAFASMGFGVALAHTGDGRYALLAPASLFRQSADADTIDVAVTFPGTVVASDPVARVDGSVVRWAVAPPEGQGLWVSSLEGSRLPLASLLGLMGLGGVLLGLAASLGVMGLRRRMRLRLRRRAAADEAAAAAAAASAPDEADEPAAPDATEWAPDADG